MEKINIQKYIDSFNVYTYKQSFEILKEKAKDKINNNKVLLVVAGPNGSGKSTLLANIYKQENLNMEYINADVYAITKFSESKNKDIEAMQYAMSRCEKLILSGCSFVYETVLSHESKLKLIKKAKENGFYIIGVFVYTNNAQINVERVHKRVLEGGHNVEEIKILTRYERSMNNKTLLQKLCDEFYMFDNSINL